MKDVDWKMKTLHFIVLIFMCPLVLVVEGQKVVERVRPEVWISPLSVRYSDTVKAANDTEDDLLEEEHPNGSPRYLVDLPTLICDYDEQCMAQNIDLICVEGVCACSPPLCWVYQYEVTGFFTAKNVFSCNKCGILGSSCNDTSECFYPGECWADDFCHCPTGENYDGVCYTYMSGWSSTLAFSAIGLIVVCALCILFVNCYLEPPWRNPDAWRCLCCSNSNRSQTGRGRVRRGSCEKSPAYTIQLHYAGRDNTAFENDPQDVLVGAQGGVPQQQQQQRDRSSRTVEESDNNSGTVSSVSSANTNVTTLTRTESTGASPSTRPAPPPYSRLPPTSHSSSQSTPHADISLPSPPPDDVGGATALPPYALDGPSTSYASGDPPATLHRRLPSAAAPPSTSLGPPSPPPSSSSRLSSSSSLTPPLSPSPGSSSSSLSPSSSQASSSSLLTPPPSPPTSNSSRSSSSSFSSSPALLPRNYSKSHKVSAAGTRDTDIQLKEITSQSRSSSRSPNASKDATEVGNVSMSCTHERCQLCLPRSPSSRPPPPPTITPTKKPKPKPRATKRDISASYSTQQEDIQLTRF